MNRIDPQKHMQECYHLDLAYKQQNIDSYISYYKVCIRKYH